MEMREGFSYMKATGIVRRIDDLGRVVIPKELRRTMRLREGAPLEIFTDKDGELIFKKYSPIGELSDFAADLCESLRKVSDAAAAVCDRDGVIAAAGAPKKELAGRSVSAPSTAARRPLPPCRSARGRKNTPPRSPRRSSARATWSARCCS